MGNPWATHRTLLTDIISKGSVGKVIKSYFFQKRHSVGVFDVAFVYRHNMQTLWSQATPGFAGVRANHDLLTRPLLLRC